MEIDQSDGNDTWDHNMDTILFELVILSINKRKPGSLVTSYNNHQPRDTLELLPQAHSTRSQWKTPSPQLLQASPTQLPLRSLLCPTQKSHSLAYRLLEMGLSLPLQLAHMAVAPLLLE